MKKGFIVINLKNIYAFISIGIISILLVLTLNSFTSKSFLSVSTKNRLLPIYSVQCEDMKVSLTFDLAWRCR